MTTETADYTSGQTFKAGDRVELHPGCDLWMRGARYGTVYCRSIAVRGAYIVTMDSPAVKGRKTFTADRLRHI